MSEKTEHPTAHKLREARKKGQVAQSKEVTSTAAFLALLATGWVAVEAGMQHLLRAVDSVLGMAWSPALDPASTLAASVEALLLGVLFIAVPVQGIAALAAILAASAQVRGVFSMDPLSPKWERLNPAQGLKRLFSTRQIFEVLKVMLKVGAVGLAISLLAVDALPTAMQTVYAAPADIARTAGRIVFLTFSASAIVYVVTAAVDYLHQYYEFIKDQRMSKDDVRQEHKNLEGDPIIKSQRKSIARNVAFSAQATSARLASVLVTNPTHFAVALYYRKGETPLPVVLDKGVDDGAIAMRRFARRHGIPVFEHRLLARRLHRQVPIDSFIPPELVDEVAVVFKWVQQLKASRSQGMAGDAAKGRKQ